MTRVLLNELSNSDIDWMIEVGKHEEVVAGEVLLQQDQVADTLYLVLEGSLSIGIPQEDNDPLASAFSALEGRDTNEREIAQLSSGDLAGEECLLDSRLLSNVVRAMEDSLVLSISLERLQAKVDADVSFAAHLYRSIAVLLSRRLRTIVQQLGYRRLAQRTQIREVLFVFGELSDSDIDWMIATGQREDVPAGTVLIHKGRPVDGLYILLNGAMSISASDEDQSPLAIVFTSLEDAEPTREIARLLRGDIVGEMPFVDDYPPEMTVRAHEDSSVLMVPKQDLYVKLHQDEVFASHFYRLIAVLLLNRLRDITGRMGYGRRVYKKEQKFDDQISYHDELDINVLDNVTLAGARFEWLLKRLNVPT